MSSGSQLDPSADNPLEAYTLEQLHHRTSEKWLHYAPDVTPMWVAEMDTAPCPAVVDAVSAALAIGDTGYHPGFGYAEALLEFAGPRWGWHFDPALSRTLPDVMLAFVEVLQSLTSPGDAVVVNPPVYPPFFGFTHNSGRHIVTAPLGADGRLELNRLEAAFAEATGAAAFGRGPGSGRRAVWLLCNPHNPTGYLPTADELSQALQLADRYGVRVVSDEIHAPLTRPGLDGRTGTSFTPLLTVPGSERAVALLSASKGWNLAGLKAAVAIGGPQAWDDLRRIPEEAGHGVSHLGVIAHIAAWRDGAEWLDRVRAAIEANAHRLTGLLADHLPDVGYRPGDATFFAWLDCRRVPAPVAADPAGWFLHHARIALHDGRGFGPGGAGFVRLNLATSTAILDEAVARLGASVPRD